MNHPTNTVLNCAGVSWTACPRRNIKRGICVLPCDSCTQHRNLFLPPRIPKSVWVAGAVCSVLPDLDVIGFRFGVHYGDFWGHRGFTHSLVFAALIASAALVLVFRDSVPKIGRFPLFLYLFLATASHGLLDAMTNGGLGVAFFSPFNNHRYFLPWRPIRVSPIAVTRFFSPRGYAVLQSELLWIWVPAGLFAVIVLALRRAQIKGVSDRSQAV